MPFIFNKYKKRKIFVGFLFIFIALLIISSNFIWNIEIQIENDQQVENIYQDLIEAGLEVGKQKRKINTNK